MRVAMGILRSKATGTYYVRKKVPKPLERATARVLNNGKDRQTFLKQSLRTKDQTEAKRRAPSVIMKFDGILARAASLASEQPLRSTLAPSEIERMGAYYFALQLRSHDAFVQLGPDIERDERQLETEDAALAARAAEARAEPVPTYGLSGGQMLDVAETLAVLLPQAEAALARGNVSHVEHQIERILDAFHIQLDPASGSYRQLGAEVLRQHVLALRALRSRSEGEPIPTPKLPDVAKTTPEGGATLKSAFTGWQKDRRPAPRTLLDYTRAVDLFVELHGDLPVAGLRRSHARAFIEALQDTPRKRTGKLREAPLPELAEWGRKNPEEPKITATTVNKLLGGVQAVAQWARDKGGLIPDEVAWSDPFSNMRLSENTSTRESFTTKELQTIFDAPVFTEGERPKGGQGEAAFWLPLLALFTGARRSELAGLSASDVQQPDGSTAFVLVLREDASRGRTLKTKSSARTVPLHPELVRIGFLKFVEKARREHGKSAWLFPALSPEKGEAGAAAWTKWFGRYMRALGVSDTAKVFHSFRHTFKDVLRAAHVPEDLNDALTGHSGPGTVGRSYGAKDIVRRFGMRALIRAVSRVRYPGLDLSRVRAVRTTRGGKGNARKGKA